MKTFALFVVALIAVTLTGCGGGSTVVPQDYAIVASYWDGSQYNPAPTTGTRDTVTGPVGPWDLGIIHSGMISQGGTTSEAVRVFDKPGHEVLQPGKGWDFAVGDYHAVGYIDGNKIAEIWIQVVNRLTIKAFYYRPGPLEELAPDAPSGYLIDPKYGFYLEAVGAKDINDLQCEVMGDGVLTQFGAHGRWFNAGDAGTATVRCTSAEGFGVVKIRINAG